jgi:hypothetical protein
MICILMRPARRELARLDVLVQVPLVVLGVHGGHLVALVMQSLLLVRLVGREAASPGRRHHAG